MSDNFTYIDFGCGTGCPPCTDCEQQEGCLYPSFTDCVTYNNGYLPNIGLPISPATTCTVTDIIKKIDDIVGQLSSGSSADWTTYNVDCLAPVTNQKDFVEKISSQFCTLSSNYTTFSTTTYVNDKTSLQTQIDALNIPALTSAGCLGILSTDTQKQIDTKIISKVEGICSSTDLSSIVWNSCITTSSTPSTVKEGFTEVLSQICTVKSLIGSSNVDTYKVLTSSGDTTPDYISNKIITTPCLTSEITTDNKLKLGLSFVPPIYTFDSNVFNVTSGLQESCGQNFIISLNSTPGTGTVTSVGISSSTLDVTNSPITSSGVINLELKDVVSSPGNFNNVSVNSKGIVTSGTLQPYITTELDPTVPTWVKSITQGDITNWNNNSAYILPTATGTTLGGIKVGDSLSIDGGGVVETRISAGYGINIDSNYILGLDTSTQNSLNKANSALQNITGYIASGSNISISGTGVAGDPYIISATGSGGGQVNSVVAGNHITIDNTDPVNPIVNSVNEITTNSYNYNKVVNSANGFSTEGGFATIQALYVNSPSTTYTVPVNDYDYQFVLILGNEGFISIPDPALFIGRELRFKVQNATNITTFTGAGSSKVYNGGTPITKLSATSTDWTVLKLKAGASLLASGEVIWEITELYKLDSTLVS